MGNSKSVRYIETVNNLGTGIARRPPLDYKEQFAKRIIKIG